MNDVCYKILQLYRKKSVSKRRYRSVLSRRISCTQIRSRRIVFSVSKYKTVVQKIRDKKKPKGKDPSVYLSLVSFVLSNTLANSPRRVTTTGGGGGGHCVLLFMKFVKGIPNAERWLFFFLINILFHGSPLGMRRTRNKHKKKKKIMKSAKKCTVFFSGSWQLRLTYACFIIFVNGCSL